ncbi:glucan endo-1,3-beta-glucosidase 5-like [Apium graveolens]|uniref:glucan endo-1,3-beta-glucosidase 5-like n=1 Tax=Apium graveolens TaxID=4045 RepID=UPI003D79C5A6
MEQETEKKKSRARERLRLEKETTEYRGEREMGSPVVYFFISSPSAIVTGNELFLKAYNGSNLKTLLPAMENIQKALNEVGHNNIKVTTPQNVDVYESGSGVPSDGHFRSDIKDIIGKIAKFLSDNDSMFLVNIYPFLSLYQNPDFPVQFAFFDGGAKPVQDKNISYNNMFDANLDTLYWSLKKA